MSSPLSPTFPPPPPSHLLPELSIVIEVEFCVDAVNPIIGGDCQGVDLNLSGVSGAKHSVEGLDLGTALLDEVAGEVKGGSDLIAILIGDSLENVNGDGDNLGASG